MNARWDAVDAALRETNVAARGRRSRVVLAPRCWRQVLWKSFREATVARKPGHRGEHEVSCKTIARGKPDVSG
jgi:hypothetical protein